MPDRTTPNQPNADADADRDEEVETHIDEAGRFDTGLGGTAERQGGTPSARDFTTADTETEAEDK